MITILLFVILAGVLGYLTYQIHKKPLIWLFTRHKLQKALVKSTEYLSRVWRI